MINRCVGGGQKDLHNHMFLFPMTVLYFSEADDKTFYKCANQGLETVAKWLKAELWVRILQQCLQSQGLLSMWASFSSLALYLTI